MDGESREGKLPLHGAEVLVRQPQALARSFTATTQLSFAPLKITRASKNHSHSTHLQKGLELAARRIKLADQPGDAWEAFPHLKLHMSTANKTGYANVDMIEWGTFRARAPNTRTRQSHPRPSSRSC